MSDDQTLKEIKERFDYDTGEWREIRDEGKVDIRYCAGDTWEHGDRKAREDANRPVINMDELSQHVNQLINDVRQNKRAIKVSPAGSGADDDTADFRANKIREIEYRSHAQEAYTVAFENAVQRGYGFFRITTKAVAEETFDQELWIEPIYNPDFVTPDANALKSTASDMKHCTVHEPWAISEFKRTFGKDAKVQDFSSEVKAGAASWFKTSQGSEQILLAEHWAITTTKRRLLLLKPSGTSPQPIQVFEDLLPKTFRLTDDLVLRERDVEVKKVIQYLTNGVEILKTTPWAGKWIPIVAMYGKVMYVDDGGGSKRQILSLIRLARGAAMLYNYYRTCEAELVGMTPKFPYFIYEGQLSPTEQTQIEKSLHEPIAVVKVKATVEGMPPGTILPHPQRQPYEPPIEALEVGAESARRGIMSAIGSTPLPTQAQRRNEKSGVALKHMEDSAQRGSFHFVDHYEDALRHAGVILDDLIPKIHDTVRDLAIRKPDESAETIRVNDPDDQKSIDTSKGLHDITISTGPAFESEREAESDFADVLMGTPFAPLIADLAVKLKGGGPVLDEMAERLTPPQFRKPKPGELDPQQLMQAIGQAKQENAHLKQLLSQIALDLKAKKYDLETKERIASADRASKERIAGLQAISGIKEAEIKTGSSETIAELEAQIAEAQALLEQQEADLDRRHDVGMAAQAHAHGQELAGQQHAQALQQGQQGHQQTLEQTEQAADLAPEPTEGA